MLPIFLIVAVSASQSTQTSKQANSDCHCHATLRCIVENTGLKGHLTRQMLAWAV